MRFSETISFLEQSEASRYAPGEIGFVTRTSAAEAPELGNGFTVPWWYGDRELVTPVRTKVGIEARPAPCVLAPDLAGRALPLHCKADTGPGQYRVEVTLAADKDTEEALLFVSRRRLVWRGALRAGQTVTVRALCDVSPIIPARPSGMTDAAARPARDTSVDLTVIGAALASVKIEPYHGPALYLMGDSTVTDQKTQYPYAPGATYAGWGQMLPLYLGEQYCVSNHAHSGLSTETFRSEGHYDLMFPLLRKGDLVLIQFAHNDQKRLHLAANAGYRENLLRYLAEIRSVGARPVLVTPLARNTWSSETDYNDMLAPFAQTMKELGQSEGVPVLDLHAAMKRSICQAGMQAARVWFHPCDYTHTNDFGAHMVAGFVAAEMVRAGLAERRDIAPWPVREPLTLLQAPEHNVYGATPPTDEKPLVDYGLIPGAPWPIT